MNRFAHVCKTGLAAFILMAAVVACGSDDASRDRNSLGVQGTACVKPGQVTKVSKQSVVCAKTNIGPLWYATMKAKGKAQTCKSPGMIRKKSNIVWACGVVKSKKLWQATQPLPAAVLASTTGIEPGASQSNPALDSTQVQAAADNVVLADPKIPDDKTVTQVQVIEEATTPPSTVPKTAITSPTMATPTTYFSATTAVAKSTIPSPTTAYTPTTIGTIVNSTAYAPKTTIASPTTAYAPQTTIASPTTAYAPQTTIASPTTVTTTVINTISATCAKGGTCKVGDVGPGGGKVFYVATSAFTSTGSACSTKCLYLEAAMANGTAPSTWRPDTAAPWTCSNVGTGVEIGSGKANTSKIVAKCPTPGIAADVANKYFTSTAAAGEWFLPSRDELAQLHDNRNALSSAWNGGFSIQNHWSSSEWDSWGNAWNKSFYGGIQYGGANSYAFIVRPIRAF